MIAAAFMIVALAVVLELVVLLVRIAWASIVRKGQRLNYASCLASIAELELALSMEREPMPLDPYAQAREAFAWIEHHQAQPGWRGELDRQADANRARMVEIAELRAGRWGTSPTRRRRVRRDDG